MGQLLGLVDHVCDFLQSRQHLNPPTCLHGCLCLHRRTIQHTRKQIRIPRRKWQWQWWQWGGDWVGKRQGQRVQMLKRSHEKSHTSMKSPWLANFWCSGMVENTDSTKQLKTSRKLEGTHEKQDSLLTHSFINNRLELRGNQPNTSVTHCRPDR